MAINPQKFLPISSSSSAIAKSVRGNLSVKKNININPSKLVVSKKDQNDTNDDINYVNVRLINIDKILKKNFLLQQKDLKKQKKEDQDKKFEEKEDRLERKKEQKENKISPLIPQLGIFDRLKRFILFSLFGWVVNKLFKYLPQLLEFSKKIAPVVQFIETFVGNVFKSLVNFIDFGYDAYDTVRDFTKKLGGEPFQKAFDDFSKNLNTFVNLALVAGMAATGGTDFGRRGGPGGGKGGPSGGRPGRGGGSRTTIGGINYRGTGDNTRGTGSALQTQRLAKGKFTLLEGGSYQRDIMKRYFQKYGRDQFIQRFGQEGLKELPGGMARSGLTRFGRNALVGTLGKSGAKQAFKILKPIMGKIPIIGGLIEFGLSWALGDPIGKAAFRGIGAVLVGAIGTAVGGPIGAALGAWAGGEAGGALYDVIFENKKKVNGPQKPEIKAKAKGGQVTTRKGKVVGGAIKRTLRRTIPTPTPRPIIPGASVGGKKQIQKIFPEPQGQQIGKTVDPFGFLKTTSENMGQIPFLGPLFSLFGKVILGQTPNKGDYSNIGLGINAWLNNAISKGFLKGNITQGFADGGLIDFDSEMRQNISGWVEKSVEELVKNKVTEAINELRKNLGMEPLQESIPGQTLPSEGEELGSASDAVGGARLFMAAGFPPLAAAILAGNVQAESGWKGQRTPWVLNDGAGTNKGLISWNRSRIVNAEKFLGKPLETASNAEQVRWIKEELKQYGLLDEFMDPTRTEQQLKNDSYKYIRWGIEGDRWKYSKQIYAAIQKGEQGTYAPPTSPAGKRSSGWAPKKPGLFNAIEYITGDRTHSNYDLDGHGRPDNYHDHIAFRTIADKEKAKRALRAANIQIGSEFRQGDRGYHGANLAIDVPGGQWGGGPRDPITGDHFAGSKKVREVLGLKDGGIVSPDKKTPNIKSLQTKTSYDESTEVVMVIQPIIVEKVVPVKGSGKMISFPGGGVNSNNKISQLSIR